MFMLMMTAAAPLRMSIALESAEAMPMPVVLVLTICQAIVTSLAPQPATIPSTAEYFLARSNLQKICSKRFQKVIFGFQLTLSSRNPE